jgi:hypothetical protein
MKVSLLMDPESCGSGAAPPSVGYCKPDADNYRLVQRVVACSELALVHPPLVAGQVIAPAAGTDLGLDGTGAPRGDVVAEVHERLVDADDIVADRATRGFHDAPLSRRVSHSGFSIGHALPRSIRRGPQPTCEELLSLVFGDPRSINPARADSNDATRQRP